MLHCPCKRLPQRNKRTWRRCSMIPWTSQTGQIPWPEDRKLPAKGHEMAHNECRMVQRNCQCCLENQWGFFSTSSEKGRFFCYVFLVFHKSSFARFDNRIGVESTVQEAKRAVTGFPDMLVEDLCHNIPLTLLFVASCLCEGTRLASG